MSPVLERAPSRDLIMATTTTILKLQLGKRALMQPLRSKEIARRWLVAQVEEMDIPDFSVNDNLRKVFLPRGVYAMEIYVEDLEVTLLQKNDDQQTQ